MPDKYEKGLAFYFEAYHPINLTDTKSQISFQTEIVSVSRCASVPKSHLGRFGL